ncbi:substrate-binding domain-containing protein [Bradyrhizobium prioriisuperbiae]|uniref:substrate-binding domain-containing protein n=1 Tax=Bradyrhizobium prioriisuperbiae TaxID=2854389 RepID=UPI0028E5D6D9|nr:substrate-binding domain-containing protein [Bradyrhizobium prioritasuperba]
MEIAASAAMTALSRNLALCLVPPLQPDFDLDAIEVDGAIVVEPLADDPLIAFFRDRGVPVVALGHAPGRSDIPFVDMQSAATARLLLDHLWRPGGRIGLMTGEQRRNSYAETEAVYADFAKEKGFAPYAIRIDETGGEAAARSAAETLLSVEKNIDALCVPVDAFATGVLQAAQSLEISVPDQLRVATRYDGMRAKLAVPPLTATDLHLDRVAEVAVELLIATLESRQPATLTVPRPTLIARNSSVASR